jgi:hypothetical protein
MRKWIKSVTDTVDGLGAERPWVLLAAGLLVGFILGAASV